MSRTLFLADTGFRRVSTFSEKQGTPVACTTSLPFETCNSSLCSSSLAKTDEVLARCEVGGG